MTGKVKKIVRDKGYGFIKSDKKDYFFHRSSMIDGEFDLLSEGANVRFDASMKDGKSKAENVVILP